MNCTTAVPLVSPHLNGFFNISTIGLNSGVAAVPNGRIRILSLVAVASAPNVFTIYRGGVPISADFNLVAGTPLTLPWTEHGWGQTDRNESLQFNLSAATQVAVQVHYIVVPS